MGGESFTVLRLRLMRKLAMPRICSILCLSISLFEAGSRHWMSSALCTSLSDLCVLTSFSAACACSILMALAAIKCSSTSSVSELWFSAMIPARILWIMASFVVMGISLLFSNCQCEF